MIIKMNTTTFALFALATTFFGIGITEFIAIGVLPDVSQEFNVSISTAGLIVSLYALGVALGGVILTSITSNMVRRNVLLASIVLFIIGHIVTFLASSFSLLLWGRIISAAAHGLFFSLASAIAVNLVPENKASSAIAFIFSGFTIATAFAVPLGTYASGLFGWRIPFIVITLIGMIAFFLTNAAIPKEKESKATPANYREQLRLITHPHVLLMLAVTILGYGATFATFTYLSPILQNISGFSAEEVSYILVLYGVMIAIGNHIGGRLGNLGPLKSLTAIFLIQAFILAAFYWAAPAPITALIGIATMGLLAFMSVAPLQTYVMSLAVRYVPSATSLASSLNIASFNGGIFVGALFGGFVIDTIGLSFTPLAAALMALGALILVQISTYMDKALHTK